METAMRPEDWMKAGFEMWLLAGEAAAVMTLRGMKMAAGGAAAEVEMQRMFSEKVAAGLALQALAWRGALGATWPGAIDRTARHYRRKVSANRRRLSKI
jgi:hypothetical protein